MDILVQRRRDKRAALRFFRKMLKAQGSTPRLLVTDKLRSYAAARKELMPSVVHSQECYANNRAEGSHQHTRQHERQMRQFKSHGQAQRFLSVHSQVHNLFRVGRHLLKACHYRMFRDRAFEVTISYTASIEGCPPVSGAVTLAACTDCPDQMALNVERFLPEGGTQPVNPEDVECLQPGRYRITVAEPTGAQYDYSWAVDTHGDGQPAEVQSGESGASFIYSLAESETVTITATADAPGCVAISAAVTLEACICPDNVVMTVTDASGAPVDTTACVAPGTYTFTVSGDGVDADNTEWTRNGTAIGNGTVRTAGVTAPAVFCAEVPAGTTMSATVSRADCDPVTVSQILNVCGRFVFRACCQFQSLLILIVFGLLMIAMAIQSCPQVLVEPAAVAVAVTVALWAVGILSVILLFLLFLWFVTCPPTWCGELLPMIWQALFIAGIVFIYFGSCPACGGLMLLFGVFLLLVGAGLLLYWIMTCNPTRCQVVWELLRLGLASTIVGLVESVIAVIPLFLGAAMCISPFAIIFLWVINAFLDLLLLLLPVVCGFNPIAGSAVAANVRRLMLPRG